jgi:hypothetical protein
MNNYFTKGFIGGCLGAIVLAVIMYVLKAAGQGDPAFVNIYHEMFVASPTPPGDHIISVILFVLSGGVWGVIYALFIKQPSFFNGFLFGFLPTLWMWIAVNAVIGKPLFNSFEVKGILMPLIFNMLIWGCFIGWFLHKPKPYSTDSDVEAKTT